MVGLRCQCQRCYRVQVCSEFQAKSAQNLVLRLSLPCLCPGYRCGHKFGWRSAVLLRSSDGADGSKKKATAGALTAGRGGGRGLRVGTVVRVLESVREPRYGWGSVDHSSRGEGALARLVLRLPRIPLTLRRVRA